MLGNTTIFLIGLAFGTGLLTMGLALGYWFGRRSAMSGDIDREQFLGFLKNLSSWTSEFSGDVSKYQSMLTELNEQLHGKSEVNSEAVRQLLSQIMQANRQLQTRLDNAESKLEEQTDQISDYLTEARTDGLTGLLNRRALDQTLDDLYATWQQNSEPFCLGLIDIDHFKSINDTYGHQAGDTVLQHLARVLQLEMPNVKCIARYGGEEFAVVSTASLDNAAKQMDDLRKTIGEVEVVHEDTAISVTLSAGAAQIEPDDRLGNLVRRADEALYASKLGGRNRVHLNEHSVCRLVTEIDVAQLRSEQPSRVSNAQAKEAQTTEQRVQERLQKIVEEESRRVADRAT